MNLLDAIGALTAAVPDPAAGLPDAVFLYVSRTTPLVNVDLLIKDERGRTLLSWRNDAYSGSGWHVPGGIVRFKETLEARIEKVAETEIGHPVRYEAGPIALHQLIDPGRDIRGHFISLLYRCFLSSDQPLENGGRAAGDSGYLQWHERCPDDLIAVHGIYREHL